ncbi:MAG: peptide deformylase [Bdellovibrionota bacterium]|nr:peptide deformylase [Bdellovibrionota bacterium]
MSIKKVLRMGHPLLRKKCDQLTEEEIRSPKTSTLIRDMYETMKAEKGIGLAAPQIGINKQIAIIELPKESERYEEVEETALIVVINPELTILDEEKQGYWEGCLSVPGLRGFVKRPRKIKVEFLGPEMEKQVLILEGFLATVFQHELDHLFGKLYLDHIEDTTLLSYEEEFYQFFSDEDTIE